MSTSEKPKKAVQQVGTIGQLEMDDFGEHLKGADLACISFEQQRLDYNKHKFEQEAKERSMEREERRKECKA